MRKILVVPQFSMRSYTTGHYIATKDSHMDKLLSLISGARHLDCKFFVVAPELEQSDIYTKGFTDLLAMYDIRIFDFPIQFIYKKFANNVEEERANFDLFWWSNLIDKYDIDLIVNEVEAYSRNFRIAINKSGKNIKLHSIVDHMPFYHWSWKDPKEGVLHRIAETIDVSENTFTHNEATANILAYIGRKAIHLCPAYSSGMVGNPKPKENILVLASRLNDKGKRNTVKDILDFCYHKDLVLIVCNPNEVPSDQYENSLVPFIRNIKSKHEFITLLSEAMYCPLNFNTDLTFSTTYLQAAQLEVETTLWREYDYTYLRRVKENIEDKFSVERNKAKVEFLFGGGPKY
jgi:hypothetical protein